jgi:hypothetical protein
MFTWHAKSPLAKLTIKSLSPRKVELVAIDDSAGKHFYGALGTGW